jgi:vancomycin resistance protein YoaR
MKNPKIIIPVALFIILLIFALVFKPLIVNFNLTPPQTYLLGQDYSRLSRQEIESRLQSDYVLPESISLVFQESEVILPLATISAQINYQKTADTLLNRNLKKGLGPYLTQYFQRKDFLLEIDHDSNLDDLIANYISQFDKPFVPTEIILSPKKEVQITLGQLGSQYQPEIVKNSILNHIASFQLDSPLKLLPNPYGDLPSEADVATTREIAQKLIGQQLILTLPDVTPVVVDDNTLISWLTFDQKFDQEKIALFATGLVSSLKTDPVDAVFTFENNQVTEFRAAKPGRDLDLDSLLSLVNQNFSNLIDSDDNTISVEIPFKSIPPKILTQDVNDLGIKELLGKGSSTFTHSAAIRNFNIEKGASIINRVLVAPDETFSFVKALGEVSLAAGYKNAYIIRAGKTELDVGGGICQVSTTFFRAVLNSGLNVTERRNHAYRVSYYEEDLPPGYDATIFIPSPDLKFHNDTGHHLLIQNTYDGVNKVLTYEIYGTSDGRVTTIDNYRQWGAAPAPPAVYIDDPSLAPGQVVQDERAIPGLKTAFDWKVTRNGQTIHQKTFQSSYTPWAAVYRRGPQI